MHDSPADLIPSILASHGWRPAAIAKADSWSNHTFIVTLADGGRVVVKILRHHPGNFANEQRILRVLHGRFPHVPRLLGTYAEAGVDASVIEWVGEASLRDGTFADRRPLLHLLGVRLAGLAAVDPDGVVSCPPDRLAWEHAVIARRRARLIAADRLVPAVAAALDRIAHDTDHARHGICHGDPGLTHAVVRGGRDVSLVDWETATLGDPLQNLALFGDDGDDHAAIVAGYEQVRALTVAERRRLDAWRWYGGFWHLERAEGDGIGRWMERIAIGAEALP